MGNPKFETAYILKKDSTYQSNKLRKRLLDEGIKEYQCEICKLSDWMGKLIPLELDHIDGNNSNNEITNLRLICPNCHAQTDTYRGKNYGNAKNRHAYTK